MGFIENNKGIWKCFYVLDLFFKVMVDYYKEYWYEEDC